jgi:hypothetical protein
MGRINQTDHRCWDGSQDQNSAHQHAGSEFVISGPKTKRTKMVPETPTIEEVQICCLLR